MRFSRSLLTLYITLVLLLIPLTLFTLYSEHDAVQRPSVETILSRRIVELKDKLSHLEMLSRERTLEINSLKRLIDNIISENGVKERQFNGSRSSNLSNGEYCTNH